MTDQPNEFLGCPFCGSEPEFCVTNGTLFNISCSDNDCPFIFDKVFKSREAMISAWNTRTPAQPAVIKMERQFPPDEFFTEEPVITAQPISQPNLPLPCPFCDKPALHEPDPEGTSSGGLGTAKCPDIECCGNADWFDVEFWNKRPANKSISQPTVAENATVRPHQEKNIMTIPIMQNCSHQGEGWCLACVKELATDKDFLSVQPQEQRSVEEVAREYTDLILDRVCPESEEIYRADVRRLIRGSIAESTAMLQRENDSLKKGAEVCSTCGAWKGIHEDCDNCRTQMHWKATQGTCDQLKAENEKLNEMVDDENSYVNKLTRFIEEKLPLPCAPSVHDHIQDASDNLNQLKSEVERLRDLIKQAYQICIIEGHGMEAKNWEHFGGILRATLDPTTKGEV